MSKNSKNTGLSNGVVFFWEREWSGRWKNKWRARGPHMMPRRGQAWTAPPCGVEAWWSPVVSQVPLYRIFEVKSLKTIFWNFLRKFIFEDF
jgi:hypothetical protein